MNPENAALLVIDVQHDFIDEGAPVYCVGGKEMLPKVRRLIDACRDAGIPIVYTQEVAPMPEDIVVRKPRYNAFLGTDLEFVLNGLGVMPHDTLIVCGDATNVCVHYTAAEAHQRDYRVKVVEDCCAGSSPEAHEAALAQIEYLQHGSRVTLDEIQDELPRFRREQAGAKGR